MNLKPMIPAYFRMHIKGKKCFHYIIQTTYLELLRTQFKKKIIFKFVAKTFSEHNLALVMVKRNIQVSQISFTVKGKEWYLQIQIQYGYTHVV